MHRHVARACSRVGAVTIALAVLGLLLVVVGITAIVRLLLLLEGQSFVGILRCFFRGKCAPVRVPEHDAFRCESCGTSGSDMGQFPGHEGAGYVPSVRRMFDRRNCEFSRTVAWERGARGKW